MPRTRGEWKLWNHGLNIGGAVNSDIHVGEFHNIHIEQKADGASAKELRGNADYIVQACNSHADLLVTAMQFISVANEITTLLAISDCSSEDWNRFTEKRDMLIAALRKGGALI